MSDFIVVDPIIFQNLRVAAALAMEINTGLKVSHGSVMNLAKMMCESPKRTKKGVLQDYVQWLENWMKETHPEKPPYVPTSRVKEAMK